MEDDCVVCFSKMSLPTKLNCSHKFCFLCIKQVYIYKKREGNERFPCPICRTEFVADEINKPQLLDVQAIYLHNLFIATVDAHIPEDLDQEDLELVPVAVDQYFWFYEDRWGGWWRYEKHMEKLIEESFKNGQHEMHCQLFNKDYTINFTFLAQYPTGRVDKNRKMLRIKSTDCERIHIRGIAGVKAVVVLN